MGGVWVCVDERVRVRCAPGRLAGGGGERALWLALGSPPRSLPPPISHLVAVHTEVIRIVQGFLLGRGGRRAGRGGGAHLAGVGGGGERRCREGVSERASKLSRGSACARARAHPHLRPSTRSQQLARCLCLAHGGARTRSCAPTARETRDSGKIGGGAAGKERGGWVCGPPRPPWEGVGDTVARTCPPVQA